MCTRCRTFYFLIFLSATNDFGFCQNSPGLHLEISPLRRQIGNGINGVLSDNEINSERAFLSARRCLNEITQPLTLETNPPFASFYSQGLQVRSTSSKPVSNIRLKTSIFPIFPGQKYFDNTDPSLNIESCCNIPVTSASELLPIDTIPATPSSPVPENLGIIDVNDFSIGPSSLNPITSPIPSPECLCEDNSQDLSRIYQKPVTLQMPSIPAITPFTAVATPFPSMLHQNMPTETYSSNLIYGLYPGSLKSRINPFADVGSNLFKTVPEYPQVPISLQINLSQLAPEPPVIFILSPASLSAPQEFTLPPLMPPIIPPYPIIVKKRSKSTWRSLLPILLLTLFDGYRCNDVGCCCAGVCNIPIPYPIPMPTNNPIILNR